MHRSLLCHEDLINSFLIFDYPGFESGWGFSCLVDSNQRILFDTGDDWNKLIHNFDRANVDPKSMNKVVLSHNHWDHVDGLRDFRKINSEAEIVYPGDFSEPTEISAGIYTTGTLRVLPKEQSLVAKTEKGNIVVTGCACLGLERILRVVGTLG
jgi:7,8-dihydropterin-6-yl-methyl-4-(beta-D-ribofuranosyl)aminobenzene 5'-phosphate synthase